MASWLGPGKHEQVDLICGGSILLFRDNPCPHLGNIVTIKLSENQENVPQTDNTYLTMIVETHFRMNYSTGECKRIKKYRRLEEPSLQ